MVSFGFPLLAAAQTVPQPVSSDAPSEQPYDASQPVMTGNFYHDLGGAPPPPAVASDATPAEKNYGVRITRPPMQPSTKRYSITVD